MKSRSTQKGFTLLEAMIALVIFSISLIGIAGLQSQSLSFSQSAYLRSQATYLVYDMLDRMRANRTVAESGSYNFNLGTTPPTASCQGTGSNCGQGAIAQADIFEWLQNLSNSLPGGDGSVQTTAGGGGQIVTITVQWNDKANDTSSTSDVVVKAEL